MASKNTSTFSHEDILKIIEEKSRQAAAKNLAGKKKILKNVENQKLINGRSSMFIKIKKMVRETYELGKEMVTLKSPSEVYVFISAIWISGFILGAIIL